MRHSWPGNIRELQHVIQRAVILSRGGTLDLSHWSRSCWNSARHRLTRELRRRDPRAHPGNAARDRTASSAGPRGAAARLGLKRSTLLSKMEKLGISPADVVPAWAGCEVDPTSDQPATATPTARPIA